MAKLCLVKAALRSFQNNGATQRPVIFPQLEPLHLNLHGILNAVLLSKNLDSLQDIIITKRTQTPYPETGMQDSRWHIHHHGAQTVQRKHLHPVRHAK